MAKIDNPIRLTCCCCGNSTWGRQWWNRDTGFGLCKKCITFDGDADIEKGQNAPSYGIRGYHYDIEGKEN